MSATGGLGGLIVTLGLDAVQFFTGLSKSEQQAKRFAKSLEKDIAKAATAVGSAFAGMETVVIGAAYAFDKLIHQAANFQDLEEKTGASAEAIASFSVAAQIAGVTAEDVASSMNKLTKNMVGVDDESKAAGAALTALGIPIKEFKQLDPTAQFETLAKALNQFEDSSAKSAIAIALLGKQGAALLPFFKELAQGVGRQVILTKEQIRVADEFADKQKRITATLNLYAQTIAVDVVPAATAFIDAGKKFIEVLLGIDSTTGKITNDAKIRQWAEDAAKWMGYLITTGDVLVRTFAVIGLTAGAGFAQVAAAAKFNFTEVYRIGKEWQQDMQEIFSRSTFSTLLEQQLETQRQMDAQRKKEDRGYVPVIPKRQLQFGGAVDKDKATREAKLAFDAQLREQERFIKQYQDAQKDQEQDLKGAYELELIGFRDFNQRRLQILDDTTRKISDAYGEQVRIAKAFAERPGQKQDERIANQTKYLELVERQADFERDMARERKSIILDDAKSMRAYEDSINEVQAAVLELTGDLEGAAKIRFEAQNRSLRAAFLLNNNPAAAANLDIVEKQTLAQVKLNKAALDYQTITEQLGIEQERIDLATKSGVQTSLDAINKRSEVARKYSALLQTQLEIQRSAAQDLAGPARVKAELDIARLENQIEALNVAANELENTFRQTFEDAFADNLASVIDGTKSVKEAFKDMARSIEQDIIRIASRNIAESIFGTGGPGAAAPNFLASLFGAGASAGGNFFKSLFSGGIGTGDTAGAFIPAGGGFASGGAVSANKSILVGEKGPEIFQPFAAGNIISNDELRARRAAKFGDVNISINVPGNVSRDTASQIALQTAAALRRVSMRDG